MNPVGFLFIGFGAVLTLIGIALFVKMGTQGTSSVKALGFEFQLGGSALVVFVVGAILVMLPVLRGDLFFSQPGRQPGAGYDRADVEPSRNSDQGSEQPAAPLQPESTQPLRPDPQQSFIVLERTFTQIDFKDGEFASFTKCLDHVATSDDQRRECVLTPERVWCSRGPGEPLEWQCFVDETECERSFVLEELIHAEQPHPQTVKCVALSFSEARRRVRASAGT
jgi:hypothetical protein